MNEHDEHCFLMLLNEMAEYFRDELTESRQRTYLRLCEEEMSIDEWVYACEQAMKRETFHAVPLIAGLMTYVDEYRRAIARQYAEYYATLSPQQLLHAQGEWDIRQLGKAHDHGTSS